MDIHKQKIIMFIPIANFILVFVWLKFISNNNLGTKYFVKVTLKIVLYVVVLSLVFEIINLLVNNPGLLSILSWIEICITLFLIAFTVVKEQEHQGQSGDGK